MAGGRTDHRHKGLEVDDRQVHDVAVAQIALYGGEEEEHRDEDDLVALAHLFLMIEVQARHAREHEERVCHDEVRTRACAPLQRRALARGYTSWNPYDPPKK